MPLIGTDFTDEQGLDPNQNNHGPGTYAPPATTGATSGGSGFLGGGSGQGKTTTSGPTSSGSNYTNLTDYLNANQGAGATMGGAASDIAAGVGKQAAGDIGTYKADATKDVTNGTVNLDPNQLAKINQSTSTNISAPTATYTGPQSHDSLSGQSAADQSTAYGDLTRLAGYGAQAAGGQAGNAALLRGGNGSDGVYSQPSYTTGENNLDAAILGGTTGGQQALRNIQRAASAGEAGRTAANSDIDSAIKSGKDTSTATGLAYTSAANTANAANAAKTVPAAQTLNFGAKPIRGVARKTFQPATTPSGASGPVGSPGSQGTPINSGIGGAVLGEADHVGDVTSKKATDYGNAVGNGVENVLGVGGGGGYFADGGEVRPDMFSGFQDDQKQGGGGDTLSQVGKLAPLVMMLMNHGGPVPGKAKYPGNNKKNDVVPAMLSKGEIVVPNSVTQAPDAPEKAKAFVAKVQSPEHRFSALLDYMRKAK